MALLLHQLVYTSFPGIGFQLLASEQVPPKVQQFFTQLVHQHWDAYNPPSVDYRAAYLYQFTLEHCLFGWLYVNGEDDMGRRHVPYFLSYYLAESLKSQRLEQIFTCLHKGPIALVDQQSFSSPLEDIIVPDLLNYEPARQGVAISSEIREQYQRSLRHKQVLNLFIAADDPLPAVSEEEPPSNHYTNFKPAPLMQPSHLTQEPMTTSTIDQILRELTSKPIGILGAVLVSSEGQPITAPVGMNENSALIMAGTMLYLATSTCEEFHWQKIESISIRAQEGYVMLANCTQDVFLLVKAGKGLTGLLEGEINRTVKKLQAQLKNYKGANAQDVLEFDADANY